MSRVRDTEVGGRRRRSGRFPVDGEDVISDVINHTVREEIAGLAALDLSALRSRWEEIVGRPAPRGFQREFLMRALAQEMQIRAFGGLSPAMKRRLRELAAAAREDRFDEALGVPAVKPGTLLVRVWHGQTHRVMVARDGFVWNGDRYGSLSTIAKTITGTSWNGWTFFGVKRPTGRNKNASRSGGDVAPDSTAGDAEQDSAASCTSSAADHDPRPEAAEAVRLAHGDAEAGARSETSGVAPPACHIGIESNAKPVISQVLFDHAAAECADA